jgi:outer membrane protein
MVRDMFARLLVMAAGVSLFGGLAAAQNKVAVIDMQQAVLNTAEVRKAVAELETKFKPRQALLEKLRTDLADILQKLQGGNLPQQAATDLQAQGQRKQREYQRLAQDSQEELDAERTDLFNRSGLRMRDVVRKIAEERALDMVVDYNQTVYAKSALDITKDAIVAFDKAYPTPGAPAAAPAPPAASPAKP